MLMVKAPRSGSEKVSFIALTLGGLIAGQVSQGIAVQCRSE
jgi:hypothetical protein